MTRYIDMINFEKLSKEELLKAFKSYAEYEANKLCGSCKYWVDKECSEGTISIYCPEYLEYMSPITEHDFGCVKWESKDD